MKPSDNEIEMLAAGFAIQHKNGLIRFAHALLEKYASARASTVAGEAQPSRQTLLDAIWRHGNARAMAEHNIAYRDEVRNTADALIALFDAAPQASAEPTHKPAMSVAEFCAEAGRFGLTADTLAAQLSQRPEFADCLPQAGKAAAPCTCPSGDGSLRHPCPMHPGADKDGGQQRAGDAVVAEALAHLRTLAEFGGTLEQAKSLAARGAQRCAALSATQAGQGERDAN
ncbi:hypothetical protein [Achromobacter xylosoxidans]|uniref:hypothetical protein n=1 Tax=Alcaligenes xylosoxydans xylosoxydans TaxID=85698 RepID=UPI0038FC5B99